MAFDEIDQFESLLRWAKLGRSLSNMLDGIRTISESDEQTMTRVIDLAAKLVCKVCRGHRCESCGYTGRIAVDARPPDPPIQGLPLRIVSETKESKP